MGILKNIIQGMPTSYKEVSSKSINDYSQYYLTERFKMNMERGDIMLACQYYQLLHGENFYDEINLYKLWENISIPTSASTSSSKYQNRQFLAPNMFCKHDLFLSQFKLLKLCKKKRLICYIYSKMSTEKKELGENFFSYYSILNGVNKIQKNKVNFSNKNIPIKVTTSQETKSSCPVMVYFKDLKWQEIIHKYSLLFVSILILTIFIIFKFRNRSRQNLCLAILNFIFSNFLYIISLIPIFTKSFINIDPTSLLNKPREEPRQEPRQETRQETRQEPREEPRQETREEPREESKYLIADQYIKKIKNIQDSLGEFSCVFGKDKEIFDKIVGILADSSTNAIENFSPQLDLLKNIQDSLGESSFVFWKDKDIFDKIIDSVANVSPNAIEKFSPQSDLFEDLYKINISDINNTNISSVNIENKQCENNCISEDQNKNAFQSGFLSGINKIKDMFSKVSFSSENNICEDTDPITKAFSIAKFLSKDLDIKNPDNTENNFKKIIARFGEIQNMISNSSKKCESEEKTNLDKSGSEFNIPNNSGPSCDFDSWNSETTCDLNTPSKFDYTPN